jgi:hypothetical protein
MPIVAICTILVKTWCLEDLINHTWCWNQLHGSIFVLLPSGAPTWTGESGTFGERACTVRRGDDMVLTEGARGAGALRGVVVWRILKALCAHDPILQHVSNSIAENSQL